MCCRYADLVTRLYLRPLRSDSVHKRDECKHPSTGRHAVRAHHQHQLGGRVQIPHHHTPSHGLWQRGQLYIHTPLILQHGINRKVLACKEFNLTKIFALLLHLVSHVYAGISSLYRPLLMMEPFFLDQFSSQSYSKTYFHLSWFHNAFRLSLCFNGCSSGLVFTHMT